MPRFFFHVQDGVFMPDRTGAECESTEMARSHAIQTIRESLSAGVLKGEDRMHWTMIVADSTGKTILSLPFSFAVRKA